MKLSTRITILVAVALTWLTARTLLIIQAGVGLRGVIFQLVPDLILLAAALLFLQYPLVSHEHFLKKLTEGEEDPFARRTRRTLFDKDPYEEELRIILDKYVSAQTRLSQAQIYDKQTELTALQSQINPHFLYNTLESIRGQALIDDNPEIAQMVEALASFFRYSISRNQSNLVTLRDELTNIRNYMLIQQYRFNNRFSLEVCIDEEDEAAYDYLVPRLIIQPVIENAIFHGLEDVKSGGVVTIEVMLTQTTMILMISDNGKGMNSTRLKELNAKIHSEDLQLREDSEEQKNHRNTGIALPNIHKRIQLLFGPEYGVTVYSTEGQGTDVEITVPADFKTSSREFP